MLDLYIYIYTHQFFVAILAQDFKAIFACFRDLAFFLCIISAAMATFELVPDFTESSGENGPESFGIWQLQEIAQLQEESTYASPRNTWTARRGRWSARQSSWRFTSPSATWRPWLCQLTTWGWANGISFAWSWSFDTSSSWFSSAQQRLKAPGIPKESDEAIPSGLEIDDTDIKFNIITKEALAEMNVYKISGAAQGNCRPCG